MIRVAVVDDHHIVRQGICRLLDEQPDLVVVAEGDDGEDVPRIVATAAPDVIVLDMSMARVGGQEALELLAGTEDPPAVVVLSMVEDVATVQDALAAGATGYVLKQAVGDELVSAVRVGSLGGTYLSRDVAEAFTRGPSVPARSPLDLLSPREREVSALIVGGYSTKQIASRFETSVKTVEKQRYAAMRKLDAPNVASFVRRCIELGLEDAPGADDDG